MKPKFKAHADPASQCTAARKGPAFFAYSDNYLIDTEHGIIMDVEAAPMRQAEVGSTLTMLDRTANQSCEATFRALRDHVDVGTKLHGESRLNSGPESLEDVLAEHADIVEAIRERRSKDARREMRHHLEHSRDQCLGGSVLGLTMR